MFIKEFSTKTGLSIDTLRYYEQEGLLLPERDNNNYRFYTEEDYCWVQLLMKIKKTGMTLANIKMFASLQKEGDASLKERIILLQQHMSVLYDQQSLISETIAFVDQKIKGYQEKVTN